MNPKIKAGWSKIGKQTKILTPGFNQRKNFFVSLFLGRKKSFFRTYDRRRGREFIAYLSALLLYAKSKRARRIILWVDWAPAHRRQTVRKFCKKHPELKLKFLPKKAPDLNPVEGRINRPLKSDICSNWYYETIDDVVDNGRKYLRRWRYY